MTIAVRAVGLGHVLIKGGEVIGTTARVQGDALALVEDFHGGGAQTDIQDLADQTMRDAVEAFVHLDVVVDTRLGLQPLGRLNTIRSGSKTANSNLPTTFSRRQTSFSMHSPPGSIAKSGSCLQGCKKTRKPTAEATASHGRTCWLSSLVSVSRCCFKGRLSAAMEMECNTLAVPFRFQTLPA